MIDKNKALVKANEYFEGELLKLVENQIENFYEAVNNYEVINNYKIGEDVVLDENTIIHGSRLELDDLSIIKETGIISPEFFSEYNPNKKKPFVVEFWKIEQTISLKNFIEEYCGVTIEVKAKDGSIMKRIITSLKNIEEKILELKDYRDYIIYQNQEQRFMPNKFNKNSNLAFIVRNNDNIKQEIIKNDIFSLDFNQDYLKLLLPEWFYEKYMITRNFDNYETGRERAIIFGIPSSFIEGIIISEEIANDIANIEKIKSVFPACYICNIEGKVIA